MLEEGQHVEERTDIEADEDVLDGLVNRLIYRYYSTTDGKEVLEGIHCRIEVNPTNIDDRKRVIEEQSYFEEEIVRCWIDLY